MSVFEMDRMDAWVDARLEAYVDGDLPLDERSRLESYVDAHPESAEKLRLAKMVTSELGAIESPECPADVIDAVLAHARREAVNHRAASRAAAPGRALRDRINQLWEAYLWPSIAVAGLAAFVVAGALLFRSAPEFGPIAGDSRETSAITNTAATQEAETDLSAAEIEGASPAQVEKALNEAKWALAFVSDVSRQTGQTIRRDVLEERVARPIRRALETAFDEEPTS